MTAIARAQKSGHADEAAYKTQKMTSLHSETPLPMQKVLHGDDLRLAQVMDIVQEVFCSLCLLRQGSA